MLETSWVPDTDETKGAKATLLESILKVV